MRDAIDLRIITEIQVEMEAVPIHAMHQNTDKDHDNQTVDHDSGNCVSFHALSLRDRSKMARTMPFRAAIMGKITQVICHAPVWKLMKR